MPLTFGDILQPHHLTLHCSALVLTLALSACGWTSPDSPRPDRAKTSALTQPADTATASTPWAILDNGIATVEGHQDGPTPRREHWATARALTAKTPRDAASVPDITASIEDLDLLALASRPEIKADSKSLKDVQALREKTLGNFPGIRDVLAQNLTGNQWAGFVSHFTEGLVRIHTVPVVMKDDASKKFLQSMQQQAMTAAVLTQVHLAYNDYAAARATMKATPTRETVAQVWNNYTILMQSLGADAMPQDAGHLNTAQLSTIVNERLLKTDPAAISQWVQYARAERPAGAKTGDLPPDITLVAYQPDVTMPLAQKIGAQNNIKGGDIARDPASFLRVSSWQVRSLLDAPISEQ
ncbi:MAG: hypothetical protein JWO78_1084 [Micavibrio sp.]|nr:hypothetical protein [Micavibrio sp.]